MQYTNIYFMKIAYQAKFKNIWRETSLYSRQVCKWIVSTIRDYNSPKRDDICESELCSAHLAASLNVRDQGVRTNNQMGPASEPIRIWEGLDKARYKVPIAL